jgi:hypothetical protein
MGGAVALALGEGAAAAKTAEAIAAAAETAEAIAVVLSGPVGWTILAVAAAGAAGYVAYQAYEANKSADQTFDDAKPCAVKSCPYAAQSKVDTETSDTKGDEQAVDKAGSQERDNITPERAKHILDGDRTGGGHRAGTGEGKSEFPSDWSDDKILDSVSDVAKNGKPVGPGRSPGTTIKTGTVDGVEIETVVNSDGSVRTAYPRSGPGVVPMSR